MKSFDVLGLTIVADAATIEKAYLDKVKSLKKNEAIYPLSLYQKKENELMKAKEDCLSSITTRPVERIKKEVIDFAQNYTNPNVLHGNSCCCCWFLCTPCTSPEFWECGDAGGDCCGYGFFCTPCALLFEGVACTFLTFVSYSDFKQKRTPPAKKTEKQKKHNIVMDSQPEDIATNRATEFPEFSDAAPFYEESHDSLLAQKREVDRQKEADRKAKLEREATALLLAREKEIETRKKEYAKKQALKDKLNKLKKLDIDEAETLQTSRLLHLLTLVSSSTEIKVLDDAVSKNKKILKEISELEGETE